MAIKVVFVNCPALKGGTALLEIYQLDSSGIHNLVSKILTLLKNRIFTCYSHILSHSYRLVTLVLLSLLPLHLFPAF